DPGGAEPVSSYAAVIDWGDDTTSPGAIALNGTTFTVAGGHSYATQGACQARITLTHGTLPALVVSVPVMVTAPALVGAGTYTLAAMKGTDTGPVTVATFTDPTG